MFNPFRKRPSTPESDPRAPAGAVPRETLRAVPGVPEGIGASGGSQNQTNNEEQKIMSATNSPVPGTPTGQQSQELPPRKPPSRLFTEYYPSIFLFLVTAFLLLGLFVIRPLFFKYKKLQGSVESAGTLLSDEQRYLESLQRSILAAQSIPEQTLNDVDEALPREVGVPKLLQMISLLAKEQGVPLGNVQFTVERSGENVQQPPTLTGPPEEGTLPPIQGVDTVSISITVSSQGYAGTRQFLDALERNLRIFDLSTIALSPPVDGSWAYTVSMNTYALSQSRPGIRTPDPLLDSGGVPSIPETSLPDNAPQT